MSSKNVRRGVTRAGWNAQHATWFAWHYVGLAVLIGVLFQSWWAFLAALIGIQLLLALPLGRGVVFTLLTLPWLGIAMLCGFAAGQWPGAIVMGFLGSGVAYVMLESGSQYYQDLS